MPKITKKEFMKRYSRNSGHSASQLFGDGKLIAMKCDCKEEDCNGWAAVNDNELSIKTHKELYQ